MYTLRKDIKLQSGVIIPSDTVLNIRILKDKHGVPIPSVAVCENETNKFVIPSTILYEFFDEFTPCPYKRILKEKTNPTTFSLKGKTVKRDGWDKEGFPSVLLAADEL